MKTVKLHVESLEFRRVPAVVQHFPFTDMDGDHVMVAITTSATVVAPALTLSVDGSHTQIEEIDLTTDAHYEGASISVTVTKHGGDGLVNIGYIKADNLDLKSVSIQGDLAKITCGAGSASVPALGTLRVRSIGLAGTKSEGVTANDLESDINGDLKSLIVAKDLDGAYLDIGQDLGSATIGGSVVGGLGPDTGEIDARNVGSLVVGHDLIGGSSNNTGIIQIHNASLLSIHGSVVGGGRADSGAINVVDVGQLNIGRDLIGTGSSATGIVNGENFGAINIGGDIIGGSLAGGSLANSGELDAQSVNSMVIGGSIISGRLSGGATATQDGTIHFGGPLGGGIGSLTVKGSLEGNATNPLVITAESAQHPTATSDFAIGSVTVGGRVEWATILGGVDAELKPFDGNAQIGKVKIGGDWIASSLAAGVDPHNGYYGDSDDTVIGGPGTPSISRIASISVGGAIFGTGAAGDFFGFVAHEIDAFSVGGSATHLTPGAADDVSLLTQLTSDVMLREV